MWFLSRADAVCAEGNAGKPVQATAHKGRQHLLTDDNYHTAQSQTEVYIVEKNPNLI